MTSQHRKATDYGLHCHTIFSNATVVLGCWSISTLRKGLSTTKVRTFQCVRWKKTGLLQRGKPIFSAFLNYIYTNFVIVPASELSLSWSCSMFFFFFSCLILIVGRLFYIIFKNCFNKLLKPKTLLMVPPVHILLFSVKCDWVSFQEILSMLYFHSGRGTALTWNSMTGLLECPRVCNEKSLYLLLTQSHYYEWHLARNP